MGKQEEQFSSNLEVINSYSQGSAAGSYVVRSGDSLQGIAQNLWGDSGLWYKLAEANGLSGAASLFEGQTLRLPAGVMRNTYNASSVTPYNPAETLGDVTPSTPQAAPPKKQKCGIVGQVLLVVIAIIVVALTRLPIQNFLTSVFQTVGVSQTVAATTAAALSYRAANAIGSMVSQAVGVATGIQEKFSWSEVARAYRSAGVDQGPLSQLGRNLLETVLREAAKSAINQSINMTLGLQDKFSWAAVAAAGVGGGIGYKVGNSPFLAKSSKNVVKYTVSVATAVANAATRSVLEGTDFGDNLRSAVPSIVGNMIADGLSTLGGFDLSPGVPDSQGASQGRTPRLALGTIQTNAPCETPRVQALDDQDEPVEVVVVHGYRNTLRGQLSKAIDAGISIGNKLVVGAGKNLFGYAPLDGSNSALNTWRTYQNIHNLGSYTSTLDGVEVFGKNGTVGGALFENFRDPSALGFAGAALEVVPLLRVVPSQTVSRIVAKGDFSVPAKALDIVPEGPLLSIAKGPTINVVGPRGISGPGPFAGADTSFTIAGGVNFQVAVPTARVGSAAESLVAKFGTSTTSNYRKTFFAANPELEGQVVVHHAVEQQALKLYPSQVTASEINSLENLRGIPIEINSKLHLSTVRKEWNRFYLANPDATKAQLLQKATEIDMRYGSQFNPPLKR
ncbi:MAG: LysM peptidoglycan-binding domain-containing protein [Rhodocyclaceae bacterium]|nr:LysM peptidoglycan-binding domain-containing protein [Rhodocyclaceae bacterium]